MLGASKIKPMKFVVPEDSDLMDLLDKYCLVNEVIHEKPWIKKLRVGKISPIFAHTIMSREMENCIDLRKVDKIVLRNLCLPDSPELLKIQGKSKLKCKGHPGEGQKAEYCGNLVKLINFVAELTHYLKTESRLAFLLPKVTLIGSVYESTCLAEANELDCNISFER